MRTRVLEDNDNGVLIVEADSADLALEELAALLGPGIAIESARRITRGGLGGFFARERFEVAARIDGSAPEEASEMVPVAQPAEVAAMPDFGAALEEALFGEPSSEVDIADWLLNEPVAGGPLATSGSRGALAIAKPLEAEPADPPLSNGHAGENGGVGDQLDGAPAWRLAGPAAPVLPTLGRPAWSRQALVRLGLPTTIVDSCTDLDTRDDLGWINALADAVAPSCRAISDEPAVLAGDGAPKLAAPFGLPVLHVSEVPRADTASLCASVADDRIDIDWLGRLLAGRFLHVVVGSTPWMHLLVDDPIAVSYVTDAGVVDALYVSQTLGSPLGYGTADDGKRLSRVGPIDVALTIRRLVGRE